MRMLTFGFAMMISVQKKPDGNKCDFCRFSMTLKMVTFVPVQIQMVIFQKALTFFAFIGYPNLKDSLLNAHN